MAVETHTHSPGTVYARASERDPEIISVVTSRQAAERLR
jgi:hypothetical protein